LHYTDADGNPPTQFQLYDGGTGANSGYFWTPDNAHKPADRVVRENSWADLANVWVRGGAAGGSETMYVRAFDGADWRAWDSFTLTTQANNGPVATIADHSVHANEWTQVKSWLSYADVAGKAATQFQFFDGGTGATSGYFWTPDNAHQPAGANITVNAVDLANVWVRGGAAGGSETMYVRAFNGTD